jgi:hypothetical protein
VKKSDLKTGMLATLRNGLKMVVLIDLETQEEYTIGNVLIGFRTENWMKFSSYDDNLCCIGSLACDYDIVEISIPNHGYDLFCRNIKNNSSFHTIWKREQPKEMTVEEIQQALGYKIKVVESKK